MNDKTKAFFKRLKKNKQMIVGLSLLAILLLIAFFGPALAPYDPDLLYDQLHAPCAQYILGTDHLGRDVLSMILYGVRTSLLIGFIAALISACIGVTMGGIAGYFGGWIDKVLNEVMNVFMMLPTFFLILLIVALFGSSIQNVMIVIGCTSWVGNARLMRAQAKSIKERTFIKSCIAMGESKLSILLKHVIPNGIFPIVAQTTMNISGAILTEAGLSFLGVGDPNVYSLGTLIDKGKMYMPTCWWISTFAGLMCVVIVLTFFLLGDGLNRVLSPKMDANK